MKTLENSTTEPGTKTPAKKVVLFSFLSLISSFLVACFPLVYFTNRNLEWINTHDFFSGTGRRRSSLVNRNYHQFAYFERLPFSIVDNDFYYIAFKSF